MFQGINNTANLPPQLQQFAGAGGLNPQLLGLLMQFIQHQMANRQAQGGLPNAAPQGGAGAGAGAGAQPLNPQQMHALRHGLRDVRGPLRPMLRNLLRNGLGQAGPQGAFGQPQGVGPQAAGPRPFCGTKGAIPQNTRPFCGPRAPIPQTPAAQPFCGTKAPLAQTAQPFCGTKAPIAQTAQPFCAPKGAVAPNAAPVGANAAPVGANAAPAANAAPLEQLPKDWLAKHGKYTWDKNNPNLANINNGQYKTALYRPETKDFLVTKNDGTQALWKDKDGRKKVASPLTFDLNGDGKVGTTGTANGKKFDIDGDGKVDKTAWAGKGDGVLAFDADKNGKAGENGKELFGNNSNVKWLGEAAQDPSKRNGFEALKALAVEHIPEHRDAYAKTGQLPKELNQADLQALEKATGLSMVTDGQSRSLAELGISNINLGYQDGGAGSGLDENGNEHRQQGVGFVQNGQQRQVNDVWFQYQ